MKMNFLDEIAKAFELIAPAKPLDIEYRFYYNDDGKITMCSMQQHPAGDNFIVVSQYEYDNYFEYEVKNGKPRIIDRSPKYKKLIAGGDNYKVARNHASVLLEDGEEIADFEYYSNLKYD